MCAPRLSVVNKREGGGGGGRSDKEWFVSCRRCRVLRLKDRRSVTVEGSARGAGAGKGGRRPPNAGIRVGLAAPRSWFGRLRLSLGVAYVPLPTKPE